MKRALLIFLMLLLPLHTTWASISCVRNIGGETDTTATIGKVDRAGAGEPALTESGKFDKSCCPGCHVFCHFSAVTPSHSFNSQCQFCESVEFAFPKATAYQSHIPDGPTRPKWPAAG